MSAIDHPAHYQSADLEVWDVMEAWHLPQHGSHALKYLLRAGRKPGSSREQDIRQALAWVERANGLPIRDKLAIAWWLRRIGPTPTPEAVAEAYGVPVEWLVALVGDQPATLARLLRADLGERWRCATNGFEQLTECLPCCDPRAMLRAGGGVCR